ncbi:hypothetical protein ISF_06263 [Cordyceps fumosorosea ARSEF 2679]|uniref:Uncharacterized protein n=1 Tax=Cordyceps fumosorosea (strain ARSEF 2679) TaxID=1081104 RepID=A0A167S770_CORFA|nr:hypothetical protein ISF_06263 [Cordyceps fumosorosea ARSEF 2679]OAA59328.1 hypothetical protein ISF_06263 [Cordyceps fumosorosea ARSEF 2679]
MRTYAAQPIFISSKTVGTSCVSYKPSPLLWWLLSGQPKYNNVLAVALAAQILLAHVLGLLGPPLLDLNLDARLRHQRHQLLRMRPVRDQRPDRREVAEDDVEVRQGDARVRLVDEHQRAVLAREGGREVERGRRVGGDDGGVDAGVAAAHDVGDAAGGGGVVDRVWNLDGEASVAARLIDFTYATMYFD